MASQSSSADMGKGNEKENGKPLASEKVEMQAAKTKKEGLGWLNWLTGWFYLVYEMLFQRILASHLQNPMPIPPVNDLTFIVTGSTSGIGKEIARLFHAYIFVVISVSKCFL